MVRRLPKRLVITLFSLLSVRNVSSQAPVAPKPAVPPVTSGAKPTPTIPAAAPHKLEKADLEAFFDGLVPLQLEHSDVAGASVLVMKDGQVVLKKGYGYADASKKQAVDPDTTMFRLASISKLFTWISVMQLAEQNKLDVDADINNYLDFRIAPAFGKPVTIRNLMTHTGGFEEVIRDILITDPAKASSLRNYLINNQPRRMYPPGQIPAYSNYGVGLGGYILQRISGEAFEQYVAAHVFQPLGMTHSSFHQPLKEDLAPHASEGYKDSTEQPAIGFEIFNPAPAGGVSSTAADMGRFAQALLNGGELNGHRILKTETLNAMWTRQFAASDALPAMCMGFYQTWRNGLRFIGHEGDLIAFHSMFFIEPREKLLLFVSYNSARSAGKARDELLNGFADRYYPYTPSPAFEKTPADRLKAIEGTYQSTRRADSTKLKLGNLIEQGHASVDKDGILKVSGTRDLRGHVKKWKMVGKDLWQAQEDQDRLFAIRDPNGKVIRVAIDFPGVQEQRVPWYENGRVILPLLCASLGTLLAVVAASLLRVTRRIFLRKRPKLNPQPGTLWLTSGPRFSAFLWVALAVTAAIVMSALERETVPPGHTTDKYFVLVNCLAMFAIFATLFPLLAALRIWARPGVRIITQVKVSLVALAALFLAWFSVHWNIIGPAHRF